MNFNRKTVIRTVIPPLIILFIGVIFYINLGISNTNQIPIIFYIYLPISSIIFIISLIIYYLNCLVNYFIEKHLKAFSLLTFSFFSFIFYLIIKHENEFSNFKEWQYYDYQTIILPGVDYFIGEHIEVIKTLLTMIILNSIIGIFNFFKIKNLLQE